MPMTKFERWLCAWAGLGASIVRIVTFAKVDPCFDIATLEHYIVKNIKKRKALREKGYGSNGKTWDFESRNSGSIPDTPPNTCRDKMGQFEINDLKEEVLYHKYVAKMGIKLLDEFMELGPCLNSKQVRKLIDLRKILADATI